MTDAHIERSELDNWSVVTRRYATLDDAMAGAMEFLQRTSKVTLTWYMPGGWLLAARFSMMN